MIILKNIIRSLPNKSDSKELQNTLQYLFRQTNSLYGPKQDLYDLLGVNKGANQSQIKHAYYQLAQKYHPDKNPAPDAQQKFAEINNAYETLSDDSKKRVYDQTGMTGDEQPGQGAGGDPFAGFGGFGNFWGNQGRAGGGGGAAGFEDFADFFNMGMGDRVMKGQDVFINLDIEFMEAIKGIKKEVSFQQKATCSTCQGTKCKPGTAPSRCAACGGRGVVSYRQGSLTMQLTCSKCNGGGNVIKSPCTICRGTGVSRQQVKETISVPSGMNTGQNLRLSSKGNFSETGGPAGDLVIKVNVKPDQYFSRQGYDIHTQAYITVSQAVLGTKINVKTLAGQKEINLNPGTEHGQKHRLRGLGVNRLPPNQNQRGDHIINIQVHVPKQIDGQLRKLYQELAKVETQIDPQMNMNQNRNTNSGNSSSNSSGGGVDDEDNPFLNKFKNMWK